MSYSAEEIVNWATFGETRTVLGVTRDYLRYRLGAEKGDETGGE